MFGLKMYFEGEVVESMSFLLYTGYEKKRAIRDDSKIFFTEHLLV